MPPRSALEPSTIRLRGSRTLSLTLSLTASAHSSMRSVAMLQLATGETAEWTGIEDAFADAVPRGELRAALADGANELIFW